MPSPMEFSCNKLPGCPFKSLRRDERDHHELICNDEYIKRALIVIAKRDRNLTDQTASYLV